MKQFITFLPYNNPREVANVLHQEHLSQSISAGIRILDNWPKELSEKWPPEIKDTCLLWINRDGQLYYNALVEYLNVLHERYMYNIDKQDHEGHDGVLKNRPKPRDIQHQAWRKFIRLPKVMPNTTPNYPVWCDQLHESHQCHLAKKDTTYCHMFTKLPSTWRLIDIEFIRPRNS